MPTQRLRKQYLGVMHTSWLQMVHALESCGVPAESLSRSYFHRRREDGVCTHSGFRILYVTGMIWFAIFTRYFPG